jgi:cyclophilin family peptidyl-prolyl cis-trans isomerase
VDPLPSSVAARAIVAAIGVDAVKIKGARLVAWRAYAEGGDLRARQDALKLIGDHAEIDVAAEVLAKALDDDAPGVVASAAEVIAAHPARVRKDDKNDESVAKALAARLSGTGPTEDLEALGVVIDAVGALGIDALKERLVDLCKAPQPSVRDHTEKALAKLMGKASPKCDVGPALPPPDELGRRVTKLVTIALDTDAGALTLELDPTVAPIAVTRAAELAKNGFYDGMVVHRVVAGFVSQFGSPTFDGYGGVTGLLPLPCETSPLPYETLSVGVALAGRDTGSSQLFVTHAPTPHLDGAYALLGRATGPWDQLVDGDVIKSAKVTSE